MPQFDHIVQNASESLLEDERLRSNLTDSEAKIVIDWALDWLSVQINAARDEAGAKQIAQNELARVRQTMSAINALAKKHGVPRLADAVAAIEASARGNQKFSREQVGAGSPRPYCTVLTSAAWQMRQA